MPKKSGATGAPAQNSALGVAVASNKKKKKKFKVEIDPLTGAVKIIGRPAFNTRAKGLIGPADQGQDLDRRHIAHYDEELKPFGELVIEKVRAKYGTGMAAAIRKALESRNCARLPRGEAELLKRLITEVNSSVMNLVPDDASINKAIEIVRENLRKLRTQWAKDPEVVRIFTELDTTNYKQSTDKLKQLAKSTLTISGASTDITQAIQEINQDLIELIDGAEDAHKLFTLFSDLENSVTFDISSKASREKIAFVNDWRNKTTALVNNAKSGSDNTDELLMHLVSIIPQY